MQVMYVLFMKQLYKLPHTCLASTALRSCAEASASMLNLSWRKGRDMCENFILFRVTMWNLCQLIHSRFRHACGRQAGMAIKQGESYACISHAIAWNLRTWRQALLHRQLRTGLRNLCSDIPTLPMPDPEIVIMKQVTVLSQVCLPVHRDS